MNITFNELKKNCSKSSENMIEHKIAVLGDCATQHIATAIKGYAFTEGFYFNTLDIDYNQIDIQLADTHSELFEFKPQTILVCMCTEKLYESFCNFTTEDRSGFAQYIYEKISNYWISINQQQSVNIIQLNFPEKDDGVFGNYANKTAQSFVFQLRKINIMLAEGSQNIKNVYIADICSIQNKYGRNTFHEAKLYYIAKMPFTTVILPEIAKQVIYIVKATHGMIRKCVVLDLDNTLWGGVIGDDGLEGIEIGELGGGHAFCALQHWLKELKNRGIILAVCSKNNENTAKEPFEKHPDMVLRLDDISMFVANWEDKATNIKTIQQTLNIGMDSMVFIDDNEFERNLVKSLIPQITVPELPKDPAKYVEYLQNLNLFETASFSQEDKERTKQYRVEAERTQLQQRFASFDEYLKNLEMCAEAKPFDKFNYPRISQLSQRSNQFNLRTVRYSEADVERLANDCDYLTLYFTLKDKFGDHGLISVVVMQKQANNTLFIENWLMSCRVLKRTMEEFIINKIMETAQNNSFKKVAGEYIATPKNSMVEDIYERMGFANMGDGRFEANTDTFGNNKTFI